VVIQAIDNRNGTGQIRLMGQVWTARSIQNEEIAEGETVVVREISGVKAMVERCDENGGN
ncbi:NfeD family protein, partial [Butyricicoccus sp.]